MKTSDYVTVGFIAVFVTVIAYFLVNSLLGDPSEASVRFEYLDGISNTLASPDSEIFNVAAINPTVEVYIGSCEDKNLDGELDDEERKACGLDTLEDDTKNNGADYLESNNGLSNDENEKINSSEDYAKGTTADQRKAVEDDVNQYQQQQQATQQESAADSAARRETVSGS
ncbi:hypothetical protein IKF74_02750 [Candidatus Saccharibacteria bacterium]|nr:hypothetical protein [Candidatus Saccharibacteria bacterium]